MKDEYSEYSLLRSGPSRDRLTLSTIIETTERHLRAMCRAMQVYEEYGCGSTTNLEKDYEDLTSVFSAFYDYVDGKMDVLSELSDELETDLSRVTIEKLRANPAFCKRPLPPEAFASPEGFMNYCDENGSVPASRSESPFNDAFGEEVAPANVSRGGKG